MIKPTKKVPILFRQIMYSLADNWNLVQMIGEFADTRDVYIGW